MQFKGLEWKDIILEDAIVCSVCNIKVYGYDIKMEFRINYEPKENKYYLYAFGKGAIRRLQPNVYDSVDEAKNAAYEIYSHEIFRMKKAIDSFVI